jgi:phosphoglycolate phosphatase
LDGTLVDTVPDLAAALNRTMAACSLAPFSLPETAAMVGDGARALLERAFTARAARLEAAVLDRFLTDYTNHAAEYSRPYPGAREVLVALRAEGWQLTLCTNKPEAPARAILAALDLAQFFPAIGAGDSFPFKKPDPRHLLATLAIAGGTPERAVLLGDHANDVAAASGAGMPCIFALWGYGAAELARGAAAYARQLTDVPALATRLIYGRD